jgi:predicted nuclease of predicted toxin-antitoxin system
MSLLFDENLSHRLVTMLADIYPGLVHVRDVGLAAADDSVVWAYAAASRLAITSKDSDFRQRSFLLGAPPKVIWVCLGNCTTNRVEAVLRSRHADVQAFLADASAALLVLS